MACEVLLLLLLDLPLDDAGYREYRGLFACSSSLTLLSAALPRVALARSSACDLRDGIASRAPQTPRGDVRINALPKSVLEQ
jgi:hypothetical protein